MRVTTNALAGPVPALTLEPGKPKNSHTAWTTPWGLDKYEYDGVGNIEKEQVGSSSTYYGYNRAGELCWQGPNAATDDKLKQKCGAAPSGNTALSRDNNGNNTGTSADPITYNDKNQVMRIGGVEMIYRDLGNDIRSAIGGNAGRRLTSGPMGITAIRPGQTNTFYTRDP